MEVRINKEVRNYQESLFFGLSLRQFLFSLGCFFQYNGMNLEQFLLAFFRSEFLTPKRLVFKSENMYAKLMAHSSVKEALNLD